MEMIFNRVLVPVMKFWVVVAGLAAFVAAPLAAAGWAIAWLLGVV